MSDNNNFSIDVGYKQLNIIKHALEVYTSREAAEKDLEEERSLLDKITYQIDLIRDKYNIKSDIGLAVNHEYLEICYTLRRIAGEELGSRIINIIESDSNDYERMKAFAETTIEAIKGGADYSKCRTLREVSKVYSGWFVNKYL